MVRLKRIYEDIEESDGFRILVDRLWPRGVSKEQAHLDLWMRDIAPSTELRKWFRHDPEKWTTFIKRYRKELDDNPDQVEELRAIYKEHKTVTLLFGAKDTEHNEVVVLRDLLTSS